ncbi:MAG: phosphatidylglycerol lysyltransferase domain-containing protein [Clostridiales bacterium]|nr:MAG: phosphatidylglycerol lysyltransferase domain-containing protein [Clostridiales bacterium]
MFVNGKIAAFTIGEKYYKKIRAWCISKKADTSIEGAYTAINNFYIKNEWQNVEFVNREEDMGLEGIRKAKLSYKPHHMVEKYYNFFK